MLITAKNLKGYKLDCKDGEIGKVEEFYFDDRYWTVRYLVVSTGNWLTGRQVLVSPYAVGSLFSGQRNIDVALTKKQIEDSPTLNSDRPVSRQFEEAYNLHYGWPTYWSGSNVWGFSTSLSPSQAAVSPIPPHKPWDPNLRSTQAVTSYEIRASDGEIGHVEDFVIDSETWTIRYLVVNTRNWWPGKKVLVSPEWIERVSWSDSKVFINQSREAIKSSPEYSEAALLTRDYELGLHRHYGHRGYWVNESTAPART